MSSISDTNSNITQLEKTLASGKLASKAMLQGKRLLDRLQSPVKVVILGLPGTGKTQLLNLLAGKRLVPDGITLPSIELVWAEITRTLVTMGDQSVSIFDGVNIEQLGVAGSTFGQIEINLPNLECVSLLDVVVRGTLRDQEAAIDWAVQRADILIWCSQEFTTQEQKLWSRVPEFLKDHSFFALTKADELSSQGVLPARISNIQDIVSDEFHSLVPVATLQGIDAQEQVGGIDHSALGASGGAALMATIFRQVETGVRASADSALLFLSRFGIEPPDEPIIAANNKPAPLVQEPKAAGNAQEGQNDEGNPIPVALEYLKERSLNLTDFLPARYPENLSGILKYCTETADKLVEMVTPNSAQESALQSIQDDMMEAADLILLMQMESGEGPAADAVTLLLQLQRELEVKIAA